MVAGINQIKIGQVIFLKGCTSRIPFAFNGHWLRVH